MFPPTLQPLRSLHRPQSRNRKCHRQPPAHGGPSIRVGRGGPGGHKLLRPLPRLLPSLYQRRNPGRRGNVSLHNFCRGKCADASDSEPCIPALSPHSACGAPPRAASGQPGFVRASFSSRLSAPVRGHGGSRICISCYDLGHSLTTSCCYLPPHLSILCLIIYHVVYPPTSFVYHMRSVMLLLLTILMTSWISDVPSVDVCGCGSFFRAARDVSI